MEDWQLEFEWLQVRHKVAAALDQDKLPDLNTILLLIGIQEFGYSTGPFSKEEKQDLMHVATCELLTADGYYAFDGRDADGWPHYKIVKPFTLKGVKEQERYLKIKVVQYFRHLSNEEE